MPGKSQSKINSNHITQPAGVELILESERHVEFRHGQRLLSIGCGNGEIECYLGSKHGCVVEGIDIDEGNIAVARAKASGQGLPSVHFTTGDAAEINWPSHSFDLVFCCGGLTTNRQKDLSILSECRRVLNDRGMAVIIMTMWSCEDVPADIQQMWKRAKFFRPLEAQVFFAQAGLHGDCARIIMGPTVWDDWCDHLLFQCQNKDEKEAPSVIEQMRQQCHLSIDHIGVGLFLLRPLIN